MKRIISLIAIATVALSTVGGTFSQKRIKQGGGIIDGDVETEFGTVTAKTSGAGVLLEWQMRKEKGNLGFRVYRIAKGRQTEVTKDLIMGSAASAGRFPMYGLSYSFFDPTGDRRATYVIDATDFGGKRIVSSPVSTSFTKKGQDQPISNEPLLQSTAEPLRSVQVNPAAELSTEMVVTESDPVKHLQVLSVPGVRINVRKEGLYRVPVSQLEAAGFAAGDPTNWQLYLNGVEQAITIGPDYIEFFGRGVDTAETDIQGYFLIVGTEPGKRIQNVSARPSISTVLLKSYDQTFTLKQRSTYLNNILNGPDNNYFGVNICEPDPSISFCLNGVDINFDLRGIDLLDTESTLDLKVQGLSDTLHEVQIVLNGQAVGNVLGGGGQFPFEGSISIPTSLLRDASLGQGSNVLNLRSAAPGFDSNMFDTLAVSFNRKHQATFETPQDPLADTLKAYTLSSRVTKLTGFTSANTRIFDISNPDTPRLLTNIPFQQQGSTFGATIPAGRGMMFFAVEDSAINPDQNPLTPFLDPPSITPIDGELLSVNTHKADLIIISHPSFLTQAEDWATYRESLEGGSFDVDVVNVEKIYDEFNGGVLSSDSIEAFLNYAYNNWQDPKPQYVLLVGDASHDSRNFQGLGFNNLVPTRIVNTLFTETGSDESLADFNDDGLAEMAVGRIPARTTTSVTRALNKTTNWEENLLADPLSRGALFAFDVPDGWWFRQTSESLAAELPTPLVSTMVGRGLVPPEPPGEPDEPDDEFALDPNAQANLLAAMNSGKFVVNYAGHGAATTWASSSFFSGAQISSGMVTNHNNESIFTMLTCLNGYFLSATIPSLSERLLDHGNGGAVAAWASTGLTFPDDQELMGLRFYDQLGQGNIPRLGDLIKDAKAVAFPPAPPPPAFDPYGDVRLSWALIGDPTLKVR